MGEPGWPQSPAPPARQPSHRAGKGRRRLLGDSVESWRRAGGVFLASEAVPEPICLDPTIRKDLCTSRLPVDVPASSGQFLVSILMQKILLAHAPLSTDTERCGQYSQSRLFSSPGARQKSFPCVHLKEVCLSRGVGSLLTAVMGRPSCLKRKTNEYVPLTPSLIRHKPKGVPCSNIRSTLLDNTPSLPLLLTFFWLGQAFFCLYLLFLSCLLLARPAWGKWENSAGPTSQDFWVGTAQGQRCSKDLSWQSWRRGCHEQVGT